MGGGPMKGFVVGVFDSGNGQFLETVDGPTLGVDDGDGYLVQAESVQAHLEELLGGPSAATDRA